MKQLTSFSLTLLLLLTIFSCKREKETQNEAKKQETPLALQDEKFDITSYKRYSEDIADELYLELLEKNTLLQKLEEDIISLNPKIFEVKKAFTNYDNKSKAYYNAIDYKINSINDSLLRKKISLLITNSKSQYINKTTALIEIQKKIEENEIKIKDLHTIMKIMLTLPMIEKYQNENITDKKAFMGIIKEQQQLIDRCNKLIPTIK
ncbi:MAG: hypothetical protein ACOYO1_01355 [Bacteroidales bacterium]